MLTKILFTGLIIFVVYAFYRFRGRTPRKPVARTQPAKPSGIGRFAAYGFVVVLLIVSGVIFIYQWQQAHRIVTIRVIDGSTDNVTIYQAYQKSIKGNRFESLDGKFVVLGEAERVEFIEND